MELCGKQKSVTNRQTNKKLNMFSLMTALHSIGINQLHEVVTQNCF